MYYDNGDYHDDGDDHDDDDDDDDDGNENYDEFGRFAVDLFFTVAGRMPSLSSMQDDDVHDAHLAPGQQETQGVRTPWTMASVSGRNVVTSRAVGHLPLRSSELSSILKTLKGLRQLLEVLLLLLGNKALKSHSIRYYTILYYITLYCTILYYFMLY